MAMHVTMLSVSRYKCSGNGEWVPILQVNKKMLDGLENNEFIKTLRNSTLLIVLENSWLTDLKTSRSERPSKAGRT